MEEFIRQPFLHVEGLWYTFAEGHYDLIRPNGEIILPLVWEIVIKPGWSVSTHMWLAIPGPTPSHYFRLQSRQDGRVSRSPPPVPPPATTREPPPPLPASWPGKSTPHREAPSSSTSSLVFSCSPTSSEDGLPRYRRGPTKSRIVRESVPAQRAPSVQGPTEKPQLIKPRGNLINPKGKSNKTNISRLFANSIVAIKVMYYSPDTLRWGGNEEDLHNFRCTRFLSLDCSPGNRTFRYVCK